MAIRCLVFWGFLLLVGRIIRILRVLYIVGVEGVCVVCFYMNFVFVRQKEICQFFYVLDIIFGLFFWGWSVFLFILILFWRGRIKIWGCQGRGLVFVLLGDCFDGDYLIFFCLEKVRIVGIFICQLICKICERRGKKIVISQVLGFLICVFIFIKCNIINYYNIFVFIII